MNSFQRIIKYCAIAFAVFLTIMIITGVGSAVFAIIHFLPGTSSYSSKWSEEAADYSESFQNVNSLEVNHKFGELVIKTGDELKVIGENVPKRFKAEVDSSGKLTVDYNSDVFHFPWFGIKGNNKSDCRVTIYVPADYILKRTTLNTGAGNLTIEGLKTDKLKISAGAGNIDGDDITAEEADIDGGVGNIDFNHVNFSDSVLESGVGNISISGILSGRTKLDGGVGEVKLDLIGNKDDYNFNIDSGLGTVRVNGEKISHNDQSNTEAENEIIVDSGIGNVRIDIQE